MKQLTAMKVYAGAVLFVACAACQSGGSDSNRSENFPIVIGSSLGSDVTPCIDYGARFNTVGKPYRVVVPKSGGGSEVLTRHEGMDFCASTGMTVFSASSGEIFSIVWENEWRGGWVIVKTDFRAKRIDRA